MYHPLTFDEMAGLKIASLVGVIILARGAAFEYLSSIRLIILPISRARGCGALITLLARLIIIPIPLPRCLTREI